MDGRTDRHMKKVIVAFHNFANAASTSWSPEGLFRPIQRLFYVYLSPNNVGVRFSRKTVPVHETTRSYVTEYLDCSLNLFLTDEL